MNTHVPAVSQADFPWYLSSAALWVGGISLQGFLFTWLLIGTLGVSPAEAGFARTLAELPPLLMLLIGGMMADRSNARRYLLGMHLLMAIPPLLIAGVAYADALSYAWVVVFGVLVASIQSLSDPARQALLSRVTRLDVQRTVTIMTIVTSLCGIAAFYVGGELERLGLPTVLLIQALLFALGVIGVAQLPDQPVANRGRPAFLDSFRALQSVPLARNVIGLNFLSSLFNAGAYIIVIPFIAKQVYHGDAAFLATVMIVFTCGSVGSNVLLLVLMPLRHPGRFFLAMQLTRVVILTVLWLEPPLWLFYTMMVAWGLNMGVTTTVVRTTVQELAPEAHRAKVLSILLLSFMVSAPVSASILGVLVDLTSPLTGLLPGVAMSLVIFTLGLTWSGLWSYEAKPQAPLNP